MLRMSTTAKTPIIRTVTSAAMLRSIMHSNENNWKWREDSEDSCLSHCSCISSQNTSVIAAAATDSKCIKGCTRLPTISPGQQWI